MTQWYSRFADVPEISYAPLTQVDVGALPLRGARPRKNPYSNDPWWPTPDGTETSASPAQQHSGHAGDNPGDVVRNVTEALELPGTLSDYHFAIQSAVSSLWKLRREHPEALPSIEALCLLDLELIKRYPETVRNEYGDEREYFHVLAFQHLIYLYEREGHLIEALDVASEALVFGQGQESHARLAEKLALVEAEGRE